MIAVNEAKFPATIVAIATYVIVAGIFTQSGVILSPAAAFFHYGIANTAVIFSYLNAGNLAGIIACLFVFPRLTIRQVLFGAYAAFFAGVALISTTANVHVAFAAAAIVGFGAGTGLSAGAVILAKIYRGRRRAIAFLCTDCAFSAAGYVFPSLVGIALAAGWRWHSGYELVAVLPACVLLAALRIRFPAVARERREVSSGEQETIGRASYVRVAVFGLALALYLIGQNVFTIWAPNVLQTRFGLAPFAAGGIVGTFFAASSAGLVTAAFIVTRLPPRAVLCCAVLMGTTATFLLSFAPSAAAFFALTTAFGFASTCAFKLMISIGSEQIPQSPPQLVTFLLVCAGLGGTAAPAVSAAVVTAFGVGSSVYLACAAYAGTGVLVVLGLLLERTAGRLDAVAVDASAA